MAKRRPVTEHVKLRKPKPVRRARTDFALFTRLATEAVGSIDRMSQDLEPYLAPIEELHIRHHVSYEPDARVIEYSRDYTRTHLEASRQIGQALHDGSIQLGGHYLKPWLDFDVESIATPRLQVYVPDRPGSRSDPAYRYKLEWTHQKPELNFFDPIAKATRWRDQWASAAKNEGRCSCRSATNGDETDVQAGVGILFQPKRTKGLFQFRPLVLYSPWVTLSADWPPIPHPAPIATAQSYGAIRLVAQSWRASDRGDFRTDAVRTIRLWHHGVSTPNRMTGWDESGIANPGNEGWLELPANRDRVYALWSILRCWSKSTYNPPSLSSVIAMGMCQIPFMIVEH